MALVVTLTTIPSRFDKLEPVLRALCAQTADIDEIRLYIPKRYRRFPDYDGGLPVVPKPIRIIRPEDDLGPASKVLFAAEDLRGTDCDLIYCDDDRVYESGWIEEILRQGTGKKGHCIATSILHLEMVGAAEKQTRIPRAQLQRKLGGRLPGLVKRKIKQFTTGVIDPKPKKFERWTTAGYGDIAEGYGAVLVKPDYFDEAAYDIPAGLWSVDDVWLSGHLERKGIPIWCGASFTNPEYAEASACDALFEAVLDGLDRNEANLACVRYMQQTYGIWL